MRRLCLLIPVAVTILLTGACDRPLPYPVPEDEDKTDAAEPLSQRALEEIAYAKTVADYPDPESIPLPQQGWYAIQIGDDTIEVFRDDYGIPHVKAPSIHAAFRGQGYVVAEDRWMQLLRYREGVMGRQSIRRGEESNEWDAWTRRYLYPEAKLQQMLDDLAPETREYMRDWTIGANAYLAKFMPEINPISEIEIAAGAVYFFARMGELHGHEHDTLQMATILSFLKGDDFVGRLLNDMMPDDVPNARTTDHSHKYVTQAIRAEPYHTADFTFADLGAIFDEQREMRARALSYGLPIKWGSQAWAVSGDRTTTGNSYVWAGPMLGFDVPSKAVLVHLMAPGLNVAGMCYIGIPGVQIGHNENTAWGVTVGMVNQNDIFVETLNPENPYQYWYNGAWKDMEAYEQPVAVKQEDGSFRIEPVTAYWTVHGPVVREVHHLNQAYTLKCGHAYTEVQSFGAFVEVCFAKDVYDIQNAARNIGTPQNFICADRAGNIAFFLSGRMPRRHPDQDPRLPTPGTGEYDWQGVDNLIDVVSSVNPPEGWFANFNGKPSVKTPGWWPELLWSRRIHEILNENNPIDLDTFIGINKVNGEFNWACDFVELYLVDLLRERVGDDPKYTQAIEALDTWACDEVVGSAPSLLVNEWFMDLLVELFSPDFGPLVERNMNQGNLILFGPLAYRILMPEHSGIELQGDYLHGRNKDDLAWKVFEKTYRRLCEERGSDMDLWEYEPEIMRVGTLHEFPRRTCGVFWSVTELGDRTTTFDMLVPGQNEFESSPHHADQIQLFENWDLKQPPFHPDELPPRK